LKNYEKKSFLTTLLLFFIPLFILSSIVLYMYHQEQLKNLEKDLLYQMQEYTYDFKGNTFSLDIVLDDTDKEVFKIYHSSEGIYAYFKVATPSKGPYLLKVLFEQSKYDKIYSQIIQKHLRVGIVIFFLLLALSIGFAFYALRPMREALVLLEKFLKDIIHDLNTPATSILLNAKLLRKRGDYEEIERIELCAKGIASLYKNLEFMNPKEIVNKENINVDIVISEKIEILKKIYPNIIFQTDFSNISIESNRNGIDRIIDNLLTNACKYNKRNGTVFITTEHNKVIVEDTGIGIKNISKVFQRYYKENEQGLGIGLNIVKQLCDILKITIEIKSIVNKGTKVELVF